MGYCTCISACFGCGRIFSYNPLRVPSIRDLETGLQEPLCLECVTWANPRRIAKDLEPIVPAPDAYEACAEEELP